jgi:transcriptional regulator
MASEVIDNINRNLEVIISLLVRMLPDSQDVRVRDRVLMLKNMGMRPKDIAKALGTSPNNVNVLLSQSRTAVSKNSKRGKR